MSMLIKTNESLHKKMFSIKEFFSKCDQIRSFLRMWSHLLKKKLYEKLYFFVQWLLGAHGSPEQNIPKHFQ